MSTILKVDDINVYYGSIHAIKGISFEAVSYTHLDVYKRQGYIRQDVQPLHPADRLPPQLRQAPVRIAAGTAGQQVFLVPRQHPHSDTPLCILLSLIHI